MFFKQIDQHQTIRHENGLQETGYLQDERYLVDPMHGATTQGYLSNGHYSEDYSVQSQAYAQNETYVQGEGFVQNEPSGQHQFQTENSSFQAIVFNENLESSI